MITTSRICEKNVNIEETMEKYAAVLTDNYGKQELELLDSLCLEVKRLKKELVMFKKELGSENI